MTRKYVDELALRIKTKVTICSDIVYGKDDRFAMFILQIALHINVQRTVLSFNSNWLKIMQRYVLKVTLIRYLQSVFLIHIRILNAPKNS